MVSMSHSKRLEDGYIAYPLILFTAKLELLFHALGLHIAIDLAKPSQFAIQSHSNSLVVLGCPSPKSAQCLLPEAFWACMLKFRLS